MACRLKEVVIFCVLCMGITMVGAQLYAEELKEEETLEQEILESDVLEEVLEEDLDEEESEVLGQEDVLTYLLQDPVASYSGGEVSKEDFLDFIEAALGERIESYSSADEVRELLLEYFIHLNFSQKALEGSVTDEKMVREKLQMIDILLLSSMEQLEGEEEPLSEEEYQAELEKVDVEGISDESLLMIAQRTYPGLTLEEMRNRGFKEELLQQYKGHYFYAEKARARDREQDPYYLLIKNWSHKAFLKNAYIEFYVDTIIKEEALLLQIFEEWVEKQDFFEYKVAHIYFSDKTVAEEVLLKLQREELSFVEAVKEYSENKMTAKDDGMLNEGKWDRFYDQSHPFVNVVRQLEIGATTDQVVKSITGYHIIHLLDKRPYEIPSYALTEHFKEGLWKQYQINKMYDDMRHSLNIQVH